MKNILLNSNNFRYWEKHTHIAASTKKSYIYQLKHFENFISDCGFEGDTVDFDRFYTDNDISETTPIDKDFIDGFIENKRGKVPKSSLYVTICALSHFFSFLHDLKLIKKNPMLCYPNPNYTLIKKDRSLSDDECKRLLSAALKLDPFFKRFAVLFLMGITCGLRAKEIICLKRHHLNFDNKTIFVYKGKRFKSLSVHMPTSTRDALFEFVNHPYWKDWSNGNEKKEVFFFEDSVLNYPNLCKMLNLISNSAQLDKCFTPHQMRHTMARMMFEKNIHLSIIQRQLRHKNVKSTIPYLPPTPELVEIINQNSDNMGVDYSE